MKFYLSYPTTEAALSALGEKVLGASIVIEPKSAAEPNADATVSALTVACNLLTGSNVSLKVEIVRLLRDLETERLRLAAVGVVALADTPESAKQARVMLPEYHSASLGDVIRRVDECMELRDKVAKQDHLIDEMTHTINRLNADREQLANWKEEALAVASWWDEIDSYVRKHPDCRIGRNVSDEALRMLKERDALKQRVAELEGRQ